MKYLLIYSFEKISPKRRLKFNRILYGYVDSSNFGTYSYIRKGILEKENYKKLTDGVVLLDKKPKNLAKHLKEYGAKYHIFKVIA